MEVAINKACAETLHGISAEELEQLIKLIARLEHSIIKLQVKRWNEGGMRSVA